MKEQTKQKTRSQNASRRRAAARPYVMKDQVGFLMRVAMQRHTSIFMSLMPHDLTQPQFAVLAKLIEVGTCSQNHLGRLVYLDAATIKGVIDRLRTRKLVTVQLNPKDRRRSMVSVTKQGCRITNEATKLAHLITAETLVPLKPREQREIVRIFQKMI